MRGPGKFLDKESPIQGRSCLSPVCFTRNPIASRNKLSSRCNDRANVQPNSHGAVTLRPYPCRWRKLNRRISDQGASLSAMQIGRHQAGK
jgi:hypothetical protein